MRHLRLYILLLSVTAFTAYYTVSAQDTISNGYTSTSTVSEKTVDTGMTVTGIAMVAVGVAILGVAIAFMVRNRRRSIGGIQSQDKSEPSPRTTDSINNPGSGV